MNDATAQIELELKAEIERRMERMRVAQTIREQLGGNKFIVMTGAKNMMIDDGGLSFRLPSNFAKNGINYVQVHLNGSDYYDMTFSKLRAGHLKRIAEVKDVDCYTLQSVFTAQTGLDTHL